MLLEASANALVFGPQRLFFAWPLARLPRAFWQIEFCSASIERRSSHQKLAAFLARDASRAQVAAYELQEDAIQRCYGLPRALCQ